MRPSGTLLEYLEKEKTMIKVTIGGGNKQDATIQDNIKREDNGEKNNRRYNRQDITMQDNTCLGKEKTIVRRTIGGTIGKT